MAVVRWGAHAGSHGEMPQCPRIARRRDRGRARGVVRRTRRRTRPRRVVPARQLRGAARGGHARPDRARGARRDGRRPVRDVPRARAARGRMRVDRARADDARLADPAARPALAWRDGGRGRRGDAARGSRGRGDLRVALRGGGGVDAHDLACDRGPRRPRLSRDRGEGLRHGVRDLHALLDDGAVRRSRPWTADRVLPHPALRRGPRLPRHVGHARDARHAERRLGDARRLRAGGGGLPQLSRRPPRRRAAADGLGHGDAGVRLGLPRRRQRRPRLVPGVGRRPRPSASPRRAVAHRAHGDPARIRARRSARTASTGSPARCPPSTSRPASRSAAP